MADAPQIGALGSTVFTTTFGWSLPASDLADYLESAYSMPSTTSDLQNPSMTTLVACSNVAPSRILGFAQLNRSSSTAEPCVKDSPKPVELQRLYVSTEAHGLGLGKKLVEEAERIAVEEGYETLWLGVWEENFKAQGFYGRVGFEKCGGHDFVMGTCVQTDWIMKKTLV
jgi:ribosomal protein S18 acetylase RimI-like enzyme